MKRLILIFKALSCAIILVAQAPSHLTTDLIEHTDRVFLDGYPSTVTLAELGKTVERYQIAEIRSVKPHLGWVVNSERQNTLQTAYRVLMASSPELLAIDSADVWDSGRVESDNSVAVLFTGKLLKPSTNYYWKVKIWDNHGLESAFSAVRGFRTAATLDNATARYPLQVSDEYPVAIKQLADRLTFIDFGKAAFGRLQLTLTTDSETDTVIVRLGEKLKDGRIDRNPGATIRYSEYKLPVTAGTHTYAVKIRPDARNTNTAENVSGVKPMLMPDYTGEVTPFRYCEVENCDAPTATQVVRRMVHYWFNDAASAFHSSDSVLNQVWDLCKYSIKATSFTGTYIDGDRERIPYEGDAYINMLSHYGVDREYSIGRHSCEYMIEYPTWPTDEMLTLVLAAWADYLYTGNAVSLRRYYEDWKNKTMLALRESNGLISIYTGKVTPEFLNMIHFKEYRIDDLVDWPHPGGFGGVMGETDNFVFTDYNTVVNALHYRTLVVVAMMAKTLGYTAEYEYYTREAEYVKRQFNRLLFDAKRGVYKDGVATDHASLHANMYPLALGLVEDKNVASVGAFIRSRGMACSVYSAQQLLDAVYDSEDAEYGLQLLTSTSDRSWYNMLRAGSTITFEAWDTKYKLNQDWNHAWGAAPANIIPRKLMGIEPLEPGFRRIRIKPQPASLRHAEILTPSIRGDIRVSFDNQTGESFAMTAEIPANAVAEVWLPLPTSSGKYTLTVDGVAVKGKIMSKFVVIEVGSGKHSFDIR
ncbi:MAG: family 78 glycoside hydrolase catalytic domain [Tannerella sp.]|jgi:hypothetical protein|nr:family 78 glycoside hydrolase catalytic domain [Tannerella sp.]